MQIGQSESVSRGQPSGGLVFSYDFCSGLFDHFGVKAGLWLILFSVLNTAQAPFAAMDNPFSKYLMGACIGDVSCKNEWDWFSTSNHRKA